MNKKQSSSPATQSPLEGNHLCTPFELLRCRGLHDSDAPLNLVPATDFGLSAGLPCCEGRQRDELSVESFSRIPALNPAHVFTAEGYSTLALWWRMSKGEPLYISGPAGSGKTSTVLQFCARLNTPVVTVMGRARLDRRELLGHYALVDGNTIWVDGPATLAWRYGWVLLINEFSAAPADLWVSCNDILEGSPLDCDATGERIVPHPLTRVIITDNTRGHADIEEGLFGRQVQDRSVIDRFWHLRLEGLSEAEEAELLLAETPAALTRYFTERELRRLAGLLAHAAADSRTRSTQNAIGFEARDISLSHRAIKRLFVILLMKVLDSSLSDGEAIRSAIRMAFTESVDRVSREAVETLLLTQLGRIDLSLSHSFVEQTSKLDRDPAEITGIRVTQSAQAVYDRAASVQHFGLSDAADSEAFSQDECENFSLGEN